MLKVLLLILIIMVVLLKKLTNATTTTTISTSPSFSTNFFSEITSSSNSFIDYSTTLQSNTSNLTIYQNPSQCKALLPCSIQPIIKVNNLPSGDWYINASIVPFSNNSNISLLYQTNVNVTNNFANFTNLSISLPFVQVKIIYKLMLLDSYIVYDSITSQIINSTQSHFSCLNIETDLIVNENSYFNLSALLLDDSFHNLPDVVYNNYLWYGQIELYDLKYKSKGALYTNNSVVINATFINLKINYTGFYILKMRFYTQYQEFSIQCNSNLIKVGSNLTISSNLTTNNTLLFNYKLKFLGDFYRLNINDLNEIRTNIYNYVNSYNLQPLNILIYPGSVYVSFDTNQRSFNMISNLINFGINVSSLIQFDSISINGIQYYSYRVNLDDASEEKQSNSDYVGIIIGSVFGGLIIIILLAFVIVSFKEFKKKRDLKNKKLQSRTREIPLQDGLNLTIPESDYSRFENRTKKNNNNKEITFKHATTRENM